MDATFGQALAPIASIGHANAVFFNVFHHQIIKKDHKAKG
jgi:hypothetical protein